MSDKALTPIPERVAGGFVPYRGADVHSMYPTGDYPDVDSLDYHDNGEEIHTELPEPVTPVPVVVVNNNPTVRRKVHTFSVQATTLPKLLINANPRRVKLAVQNNSAVAIGIAVDGSVITSFFWQIPANGGTKETTVQDGFVGMVMSGVNNADLTVWEEFEVEIDTE